jgi:hypothetical protein
MLRLCYSPKDTMYLLSIGHSKLYELIHDKKLDARKAGTRRTVVLTYSILEYLSDLAPVSGSAPMARLSRCAMCGELIIEKRPAGWPPPVIHAVPSHGGDSHQHDAASKHDHATRAALPDKFAK